MKSKLTLIVGLMFYGLAAICQEMPKIIPPSPNAATLGRFGDIPVNLYNGTIDVSVPIYTVQYKDISIPLILNYNTSGIRVQQEASWVGLGWNLSPAGSITRSVVGGIDNNANDPYNNYYVNNFSKTYKNVFSYETSYILANGFGNPDVTSRPFFNDYKYYYERFPQEFSPNDAGGSANPHLDEKALILNATNFGQGQPDIYYASFLGNSVQFFIDPITNKPVLLDAKSAIKIEKSNFDWIVTDENGFKFVFDVKEYYGQDNDFSSWLLSKIISPLGNEVIFQYQNFGVEYPIPVYNGRAYSEYSPSVEFTHILGAQMDGGNAQHNYYLTAIQTPSEILSFNLSSRVDLNGDGARKLESIDIKNALNAKIKTVEFNYDYFSNSTVGRSYFNGTFTTTNAAVAGLPTTIDNSFSKRLKLSSVNLQNFDNLADKTNGQYQFSYIEDHPLPLKTSCAVDHWGFYNGQDNMSLIPNLRFLRNYLSTSEFPNFPNFTPIANTLPDYLVSMSNTANRAPDSAYMVQGMLKDITYPTRGKSSFVWEPNTFRNFKIPSVTQSQQLETALSQNLNVTHLVQDLLDGSAASSKAFTINNVYTVNLVATLAKARNPNYPSLSFDDLEESFVKLYKKDASGNLVLEKEFYFTLTSPYITESNAGGFGKRELNTAFMLYPGDYVLTCDFKPDNLPIMQGGPSLKSTLSYAEPEANIIANALNNQDFIGGGIRIKQITTIDATNTVLKKRYTYVSDDNSSSGLLMSPVKYIGTEKVLTIPGEVIGWSINSSSYIPFSNSARGNLVGYSRIVEQAINEFGQSNGKRVEEYNNVPSRYFFNLPSVPNMLNGSLKSSKVYSNDDLIKETIYTYKNLFSQYYRAYTVVPYKFTRDEQETSLINNGPSSIQLNITVDYFGDYYMRYYPLLSEWNVLEKKEEKDYYPQAISQIENYQYSPFNKLLNKLEKTNSDGGTIILDKLFPNDMVAAGRDASMIYQQMLDKHIVAPAIEEKSTKNNQIANLVTTNYYQPFTGVFVPQTVDVRNNVTGINEVRLRYHAYNSHGNPLSVSKENGPKTCYVWSYKSQYPVAEIKNIELSTMISLLGGQGAVDAFQEQLDPDVNAFLLPLRNALPVGAEMTSYTYKPLVGLTSQTDAKGLTTHYEYDSFQRLKYIKDQNGNIIKSYTYHLKN